MTNREIDALIAEKVMGWVKKTITLAVKNKEGYVQSWEETCLVNPKFPDVDLLHRLEFSEDQSDKQKMPYYSTSISDAWEVVEKMKRHFPSIVYNSSDSNSSMWNISFWKDEFGGESWDAIAETAPRAICLAALKVIGVKIED